MQGPYRILLLDTKPRNPNHYFCLAIRDALQAAGVETVYARYDDAVRKAAEHECNVFLAFDGEEPHWDVCRRLAAQCAVSIVWFTDDPYETPVNQAFSEMFDIVYTNDRNSVSQYGAKGGHLPFAGSPKYHQREVLSEASGLLRYDIFFLGAAWPNRVRLLRSLLRDLKNRQFKIGLMPVGDLPITLPLPESSYLWRTSSIEFARLANRSRITLALHRDFTTNPEGFGLASTPPPRLFEAALAGTLQLYDNAVPETAEYFEPGKEVVSYSSYRECVEKIEYYLAHPEKRESLARAAQQRALREHTYDARIQQILSDLGKVKIAGSRRPGAVAAPRRKRLLFVTHNIVSRGHFGGVEVYQEGLARKLSENYDVFFYYRDRRKDTRNLTAQRGGDNTYVLTDAYYKPLEELEFGKENVAAALSVPVKESAFATLLTNYKIDLIHFHHLIHHPASLVLIARILNIPTVVTLHDFWVMCDSHNLVDYRQRYCDIANQPDAACDICVDARLKKKAGTQAIRRAFFRRILAQADAVVANTPGFFRLLARFYPDTALSLRAHAIPVPLPDTARLSDPGSELVELPQEANRAKRILRVAILGNFTFEKGADNIIRAMKQLRDSPIEFTIFGRVNPPYDKDLSELDLPNLQIHGPYRVTELPGLLRDMDISLHVSLWPETYCITVSEAWHNRLVPVVSDIGALGERVAHDENGWKVAADSAGGVVAILRRLMQHPELIAEARQHAASAHLYDTEAEHVAKLETVYRDLLARHRQPADGDTLRDPGLSRLTLFDTGMVLQPATWSDVFESHRDADVPPVRRILAGNRFISSSRPQLPGRHKSLLRPLPQEVCQAPPRSGLAYVDAINGKACRVGQAITLAGSGAFSIVGWAFDEKTSSAYPEAAVAFVNSQGEGYYIAAKRKEREDIFEKYGKAEVRNSGFEAAGELAGLTPGFYSLKMIETAPAEPVVHDLGYRIIVVSPITAGSAALLGRGPGDLKTARVESVGGVTVQNRPLRLPLPAEPVSIEGWCFDPNLQSGGDVCLVIEDDQDGTILCVAATPVSRPDVNKQFRLAKEYRAGFRALVDHRDLPHSFTLRIMLVRPGEPIYATHQVSVQVDQGQSFGAGSHYVSHSTN
ncbi:MAG: glycosyl transferase family 1 [Terriglobia bacterium]|nr:MAG: glycosyl transferase family 1 [Terriglobia bacterium]